VPWAAHNTNSTLANQDGIGPVRRGVALMSCGGLKLLESQKTGGRNPLLGVLIQLLNAPQFNQVCAKGSG
jgi:phospholipid/cholesterol/gamma-HCH transport system substrate-binding protein